MPPLGGLLGKMKSAFNNYIENSQTPEPSVEPNSRKGTLGSSLNQWQPGQQKKLGFGNQSLNGVNFHKKLKDEFDRYERYMRESLDHQYETGTHITTQGTQNLSSLNNHHHYNAKNS